MRPAMLSGGGSSTKSTRTASSLSVSGYAARMPLAVPTSRSSRIGPREGETGGAVDRLLNPPAWLRLLACLCGCRLAATMSTFTNLVCGQREPS